MKAILAFYIFSALFLSGCSAVTNYRKYELFLDN